MRICDLISKKKKGGALTFEEQHALIDGFVQGAVPDYQIAAFLMAVCFQGMTPEETASFTQVLIESGDTLDLSPLGCPTVDKHSTGGVGDKTTLIAAPLAAACGCTVAKMSGRGLGYTGGTIDKLESIQGFRTDLQNDLFFDLLRQNHLAITAQTGHLVPGDKKLYALRDVTATVDCLPLIASSVMSKKIAAGSSAIVLDVKYGSGAFMKTVKDAVALAQTMVDIGRRAGRKTTALITSMEEPLGHAVGNALEVSEAVATLKGQGPADLKTLSLALAAEMCALSENISRKEAQTRVQQALDSGEGLQKLEAMIRLQGGDPTNLETKLPTASRTQPVYAVEDGYLSRLDTEEIGRIAGLLGAGRAKKDDVPDPAAGLILSKKCGDAVKAGEVLATLYTNRPDKLQEAQKAYLAACTFSKEKPRLSPLIAAWVDEDGVHPADEPLA